MLLDRDDTHIYLPANSKPHWQTAFRRAEQICPRDNFSSSRRNISEDQTFFAQCSLVHLLVNCLLILFNKASRLAGSAVCFCLMEYSNQLDIKKTWGFYFLEESSVWKMCPLTLASRKLASQSCPARRSQFVIEQVGQPTNRPTEASWQAGLCQNWDALASAADGQKYLQSNSVKQ